MEQGIAELTPSPRALCHRSGMELELEVAEPEGLVEALAFDPTGARVALGVETTVLLLDVGGGVLAEGGPRVRVGVAYGGAQQGHTAVSALAFSREGAVLAVELEQHMTTDPFEWIHVLDGLTGERLAAVELPPEQFSEEPFTIPRLLVPESDRRAALAREWRAGTRRLQSADGALVASFAGRYGRTLAVRSSAGELRASFDLRDAPQTPRPLAFARGDELVLAYAEGDWRRRPRLYVAELRTGNLRSYDPACLSRDREGSEEEAAKLDRFDGEGARAVWCAPDGSSCLWADRSGRVLRQRVPEGDCTLLRGPAFEALGAATEPVRSGLVRVAIAPDGRTLVAARLRRSDERLQVLAAQL